MAAECEFVEWEFENFSCWTSGFHRKLYDEYYLGIKLYPKGSSGTGEYLEVKINKSDLASDDEELAFVGSDGSTICTRQPNANTAQDWKSFTGPKFEEVVAAIRRNEPQHRDRLIMRWKKPKGRDCVGYRTLINASSAFFQINPEMLHFDWKQIYKICVLYTGGKEQRIRLTACKTGSIIEETNVKFNLRSFDVGKVTVRTTIWLLKGYKIMRKYENDCVIGKDYDYEINSCDIPLKELQGVQILMRCKVITNIPSQISCYTTDFPLSSYISIENFSKFFAKNYFEIQKTAALKKDFMCLYQAHDYADFEIRCGTISFPTHRGILSARSPVLKAMLSGDMREAACGHMEVEDLEPHTLGRFLSFLYSGTTGTEALQWEEAAKLYYVADKYQVPSLKEECAAVLLDNVTFDSVCEILSLADKHQDEELKAIAHEFILENYNEVLGSENWENLVKSDSLLVAKTVTNLLKNRVRRIIRN